MKDYPQDDEAYLNELSDLLAKGEKPLTKVAGSEEYGEDASQSGRRILAMAGIEVEEQDSVKPNSFTRKTVNKSSLLAEGNMIYVERINPSYSIHQMIESRNTEEVTLKIDSTHMRVLRELSSLMGVEPSVLAERLVNQGLENMRKSVNVVSINTMNGQ